MANCHSGRKVPAILLVKAVGSCHQPGDSQVPQPIARVAIIAQPDEPFTNDPQSNLREIRRFFTTETQRHREEKKRENEE